MTKDETIAQVIELTRGQKGWVLLVADDPMTAIEGYHLFRYVDDEGEPIPEGVSYEDATEQAYNPLWPIFDKELEPQVNLVDGAEEMLAFGHMYPDCVECDDVKQLLLGLAHYIPEEGRALICQTRVTSLKRSPDQFKGAYLDLRALKTQAAKERRQVREQEAKALGARISGRT